MRFIVAGKPVWLNYHHLYYFKVIASEGSILKASQRLNVGQPALSTQLKQLEETLGAELFIREHKKLYITEMGKIVLQYANEIFRIGSEMIEAMQDRLVTNRIHVQLGALDNVPKHVVLEISKFAWKEYDCAISILEGKSDELVRELINHRIDLMISNFVPTLMEASNLYARKIGTAPVVICGASKFKHLRTGFPKSIDHMPFVMPTFHSKLRHDVDHFFRLAGIHVDVLAETQDTAIQKLMGIDGVGLIPVPLPAVEDYIKSRQLHVIGKLDGVTEDLFMIAATRKIENPVSSHLIRSFKMK